MKIELLQQPDSTIARVTLNTGEEIVAEAGALVAIYKQVRHCAKAKVAVFSADSNE
jgi:uncharacterized protein (AIM24 family)